MSLAALPLHPGPWTEQEYLALGEMPNKCELIDGAVTVSPRPSMRHQDIALLLAMQLHPPARKAGLRVLPEINLRLGAGRIVEPDLVLADTDARGDVLESGDVWMVVEIVSPSNAATDRVLKPHLYAAAGIRRYLRIEQPEGSGVELHLHSLVGDTYGPAVIAGPGETMRLALTGAIGDSLAPFEVELAVNSLLDPS